mgnify:CR=1 FL=1
MRINAKKKEHVNAPIGPFTTFSHSECDYNIRNELVCSRRDEMHRRSSASEGRFGVAEPEGCASICEGAEVESCVIMNDTVVGEGAQLKNVILDKDVTVRPGAKLIGSAKNPIIIKRGETV